MYYVFILYSKILKQFYTGHTTNMDIILKEQNCGRNSVTREGIPWIMVYSESFSTQDEAIEIELNIKKTGVGKFLKDIGLIIPYKT
jgi:putative endonuclease